VGEEESSMESSMEEKQPGSGVGSPFDARRIILRTEALSCSSAMKEMESSEAQVVLEAFDTSEPPERKRKEGDAARRGDGVLGVVGWRGLPRPMLDERRGLPAEPMLERRRMTSSPPRARSRATMSSPDSSSSAAM